MLLRVQQLVKNLNSLTCKMAALKSNGEGCMGWAGPSVCPRPPDSISDRPLPRPLRLAKQLLSYQLAGA